VFKSILVPLDGSALAETALPFATMLARGSGAQLVLTRAALAHTPPGGDPIGDQVAANAEAEAYLTAVAERIRPSAPSLQTATTYGPAAEMILAERRVRGSDLIVMATHGRGGLGRLLYGSVADEVLRSSPVAVLLVPANLSNMLPSDRPARLLVALDGSERSAEILAPAATVAKALGAKLSLLQSVKLQRSPNDATSLRDTLLLIEPTEAPDRRDGAEGHLERLAIDLRAEGLPVEVHAVTGEAAEVILSEANGQGADLIAMATHGRTGLARLVMGSVTSAVLKTARRPILVYRPRELQAAEPVEKSVVVI
jgi:nucleotide-binding universal stress UspA family protein